MLYDNGRRGLKASRKHQEMLISRLESLSMETGSELELPCYLLPIVISLIPQRDSVRRHISKPVTIEGSKPFGKDSIFLFNPWGKKKHIENLKWSINEAYDLK